MLTVFSFLFYLHPPIWPSFDNFLLMSLGCGSGPLQGGISWTDGFLLVFLNKVPWLWLRGIVFSTGLFGDPGGDWNSLKKWEILLKELITGNCLIRQWLGNMGKNRSPSQDSKVRLLWHQSDAQPIELQELWESYGRFFVCRFLTQTKCPTWLQALQYHAIQIWGSEAQWLRRLPWDPRIQGSRHILTTDCICSR